MSEKKKQNELNLTATEKMEGKLNSFLGRNRIVLIIISCVVVVAIAVLCIVSSVTTKSLENSFDKIDQLETTYSEVLAMDKKATDYQTKYDEMMSQLTTMSKGTKYPALKAQYLLASMSYEDKDYQAAIDGFFAVYQKAKGSYLGSLCLTNAAVAAEDKGDDALALEYYTKVWDEFGTKAAESPKALFNQARLQQKGGDTTLAKATFQQLIDQFPNSEFAKLAKSVVVTL